MQARIASKSERICRVGYSFYTLACPGREDRREDCGEAGGAVRGDDCREDRGENCGDREDRREAGQDCGEAGGVRADGPNYVPM